VLPTELHIDMSKSELSKELLGKTAQDFEYRSGSIELREPLQVARRGSEVRLILENTDSRHRMLYRLSFAQSLRRAPGPSGSSTAR
jgi:hypothetical protein